VYNEELSEKFGFPSDPADNFIITLPRVQAHPLLVALPEFVGCVALLCVFVALKVLLSSKSRAFFDPQTASGCS
jgi:hypothetical protein